MKNQITVIAAINEHTQKLLQFLAHEAYFIQHIDPLASHNFEIECYKKIVK